MLRTLIAFCIMVTCGLLIMQNAIAKQQASAATLKTVYLVHISNMTTWPENIKSSSTFSICINENSELSDKLKKIEQQVTINGKSLKIQHDLSLEQLVQCHIFYVSAADISIFDKYHSELKKNAVLTISSKKHFTTERKGIIDFYVDKQTNKLKMRVNLASMQESRLEISSKLLRLMQQHY